MKKKYKLCKFNLLRKIELNKIELSKNNNYAIMDLLPNVELKIIA